MGVLPGSQVSSSNTNSAFLDSNQDDVMNGKLGLGNTDPVSGNIVSNTQTELNAVASYTGKTLNSLKNELPNWTNNDVGTGSDTLKARADSLTHKFNNTLGHKHTGAAGDAPAIDSFNIANVPLKGSFLRGADLLSVTGSSLDVSTEMATKQGSTSQVIKGVAVNAPFNRVVIRQASGVSAGDKFIDGLGNEVYGRVTLSGVTWTLSFFVDLAGVETAYSFASASDVAWYFQELFNPIVDAPVYSELAITPSDNTAADVPDASETQAGKVLLSNSAPPAVSNSSSKGTSARTAHADHTHEGLHSLGVDGDATKLLGDVDLKAGAGIAITRTGQKLEIENTGGAIGFQEFPAGPVNGVNDTFGPLTYVPTSYESIIVFIDGIALEKSAWSLSGQSIIIASGWIPQAAQSVYCWYLTSGAPPVPPPPSGTVQVEYRTVTALEASNKKIVLNYTPSAPASVMLDIIGGTAQEFNIDYTIVSNELRWNGYALDGILLQNDRVRVFYQT